MVCHHSQPLMYNFNKTEAAIFQYSMLPENAPRFQLKLHTYVWHNIFLLHAHTVETFFKVPITVFRKQNKHLTDIQLAI